MLDRGDATVIIAGRDGASVLDAAGNLVALNGTE